MSNGHGYRINKVLQKILDENHPSFNLKKDCLTIHWTQMVRNILKGFTLYY